MIAVRLLVTVAFISALFFSCKKENVPQGDRIRMIRITEGESIYYRLFQYDYPENTLSLIVDSNNSGWRRNMYISYDAAGKPYNVSGDGFNYYGFEFDEKGRINRKWSFIGGPNPHLENTYSYNANG